VVSEDRRLTPVRQRGRGPRPQNKNDARERVMDGTGSSTSSDVPAHSRASLYSVSFAAPGPGRWFVAQSKTRWHWTGAGQLEFDGADIVLRGRRTRTLWSSAPQEIRFATTDVIDVAASGLLKTNL
jgi:hypothetical protein